MYGFFPTLLSKVQRLNCFEMAPEFETRVLIGKTAVPLLNGADHDEENETED